jgi:hypothetical protein
MTELPKEDLNLIAQIDARLKHYNLIQPIDTTEGEPIETEQSWKPSKGQLYYYVNFTQKVKIGSFTWVSDEIDVDLYELGNCFETKEAAQKTAEAIKQYLSTTKF